MSKIAIIGGGAFGITLAYVLSQKEQNTILYTRNVGLAKIIRTKRVVPAFPTLRFNDNLKVSNDLSEALTNADIVIVSIVSNALRVFLEETKELWSNNAIIVSTSKGLERDTFMRMTEVIHDVTKIPKKQLVVLSGPNLAAEINEGLPCQTVVAGYDMEKAKIVKSLFEAAKFRVYLNADVIGVEVSGALKNIVALAAGMCEGADLGHNTMGGLITRGAIEIERLAIDVGAKCGIIKSVALTGDLIATCTSPRSRNREAGKRIAQGIPPLSVMSDKTVEGLHTVEAVYHLSNKRNVYMPICNTVYGVIFEQLSVKEAKERLLTHQENEFEY